MRKAINENPRVQLAVLGVGAVLLVILLYVTVLSGDDSAPPADAAPAADSAATVTPDPAAAGATAPPETSATPGAAATPADPAPAPAGDSALLPGPGLPEDVLVAYARNKAIALLVYDPKGLSDRELKSYTARLADRGDAAVFEVKARNIARYARITQGVSVSRTPALVVIRPRDRTGGVPTATVAYGFRSPRSIDVALEDALYEGGNRPSFPN